MTVGADGFLLVDKPAGVTSFTVVDRIRRALLTSFPHLQGSRRRIRPGGPRPPKFKCGHTGTLDPAATGLLVVLIGRGSRLGPFLVGLDKTYLGTVRLGTETDTLDAEGQVTATTPPPADPDRLVAALSGFRGDIQQVPPLVSAIKRDGKPLYARVRAGEEVAEPDPRPCRIDRLEVGAVRWPDPTTGHYEIDLEVTCSSGTYVRSLARDVARAAGSTGHLAALRRLKVGTFDVADALTDVLDRDGHELAAALAPLAAALPDARRLLLTAVQDRAVRLGGQPEAAWFATPRETDITLPVDGLFRLVTTDGGLTAVGRMTDEGPRIAAVLAAPLAPDDDTGEVGPCA
ncbi:tRNA pseudouridine(55) synthase TruB [bacterium]|nr:MAG: tRNA pseudouridine(55) synthase TruB [bacterium]